MSTRVEQMGYLFVFVLAGLVCGLMGSHVARSKGRPGDEGLVFGFLLGPIGILIEVLMPTIARPTAQVIQEAEPQDEVETQAAEPPQPRPLRYSPGDDAAMDFTMELLRRGDDPGRSVPRIPPRSIRRPEDN